MLNNQSITPLYQQIVDTIKKQIASGEYQPGQPLPSEAKLCETFGVSRITVRNAIQNLVDEGLLVKRHGKGTFVREKRNTADLFRFKGFTTICRESNISVFSHVLCLRKERPTSKQIQELNLSSDDFVVYLKRLRFANEHPVVIEHVYLPYKTYSFLLDKNLENQSLYKVIMDETGLNPEEYCYNNMELETCAASPEEAEYLQIPTGSPLFVLKETIYTDDGIPVHHTKQLMVGNTFKFMLSTPQNRIKINLD